MLRLVPLGPRRRDKWSARALSGGRERESCLGVVPNSGAAVCLASRLTTHLTSAGRVVKGATTCRMDASARFPTLWYLCDRRLLHPESSVRDCGIPCSNPARLRTPRTEASQRQGDEVATLDNKVCVVTGGAGGIGRASAIKFAERGAKAVVIADINEEGAQETVRLIEAAGGTASVKVTDLEVPQQITELVEYTVDTYGGLDTLLNNAAVHEFFWTNQTAVDVLPLEHLDRVFRVNLRAVFALTQAAVPHLRASKNDPNIVNAASMVGFLGFPASTAYSCMKAALMQFTRVAAVDLSPEIRVNAFAPGNVDTPMVDKILTIINPDEDLETAKAAMTATHLVPRLGKAEDIANLAAFLASTDASWITGVSYVVDGGVLAWRGHK